ncbi:hypothetical protein [Nonomuraea sp. NPDC049750]
MPTSAQMRWVVSKLNREQMRTDQVTSALCSAEATIREIRPGDGFGWALR